MNDTALKTQIENAIENFARGALLENATALFNALGYHSNKGLTLAPNTAESFRAEFDRDGNWNADAACVHEWRSVDLVFQLTDDEINAGAQRRLFEARAVETRQANSYLVFCIHLSEPQYSRTQLANITRAVNKLFPMPALILFQHGETLTLSVIERRPHKRDADKDVLEKVTLIKDIRIVKPHAAHRDILVDLSLEKIMQAHAPSNWSELHDAWRSVLDTSELNKKFFKELANWYFWAQQRVAFPKPASNTDSAETWRAMNVIRLITRLMFVWFIKEKSLVSDDLFVERRVKKLLKSLAAKETTYYKAVLQNLFFGTLNTEMVDKDGKPNRKFIKRSSQFPNPQHLVHNVYRFQDYFADADAFLELCADIPFLNGGLFECLDLTNAERIDGFSENEKNPLRVPNELFFADWHNEDLSAAYGSPKMDKVRGLLEILAHYKFTVDENTPIEEEIALDPELLGKVFENLLAAYNPETGVTARKQTGSFYTPREIVNYMVDEALIAYLEQRMKDEFGRMKTEADSSSSISSEANHPSSFDSRLRHLLSYTADAPQFNDAEKRALVNAIDELQALDPACGSGAFPLGVLHKLVHILRKLDPGNLIWKEKQIANAYNFGMDSALDVSLAEIERTFERNEDDYARKLYLIQNCIYGVDIQPIAAQIAKLRCFISLIVDETLDDAKENRGIIPLPNLETKFVAANTLIGIDRSRADKRGGDVPPERLYGAELEQKCNDLVDILRQYLKVKNPATQKKYLELGEALGAEINTALAGRAGFEPLNINWFFTTATSVDALVERLPIPKQGQAKTLSLRREDIEKKEQQLEKVRRAMFGARTFSKKKQFREQDARLRGEIADLLKKDGMGDATAAQLAAWDPYDQNKSAPFFDADWMFGVAEGFDVVIGNPPYIDSESMTKNASELREIIQKSYSMTKGNWDIYIAFYELGFNLLSDNGVLSYITPDKWISKPFGDEMRLRTTDNLYSILKAGRSVFESANVDAIVSVFGKSPQAAVRIYDFSDEEIELKRVISKSTLKPPYTYDWMFSRYVELLSAVQARNNSTLREYGVCENACATSDAYKLQEFIVEEPKHPKHGEYLKIINTGTIGKYVSKWGQREMVYLGNRYLKPMVNRKQFLEAFRNSYGQKSVKPKIILKGLNLLDACLDSDGTIIPGKTTLIISASTLETLKFLLAIVNSTAAFFYLKEKYPASSYNQGTTFTKEMINELPIPKATRDAQNKINSLVDRILAAKRADVKANTTAWEREIDELVYALYGLTAEEIGVVEGRGRLERE